MSAGARDGLGRRSLELAVLCAFAFAQPLFDLLGRNAVFFAVRSSPGWDIVAFAAGVVILPPLVLVGAEALVGLVGRRAQDVAHAACVAVLGALIAIQVVKRLAGALPAGLDLGVALAAGLTLAWGLVLRRGQVIRTFVAVLSPAPLLFLALFLLGSPVRQLLLPEQAEATADAGPGAPVVMVVFDEFPSTSLLAGDGQIDRVRYPNFATLAGRSTWYANATTVVDSTTHAVPAILDGRRPRKNGLPTLGAHPRNLFTLLGRSYRLNVVEEATHLCPRKLCPEAGPGLERRLRSLASDVGVIYAHTVMPAAIEDRLPSIAEGWGDFDGGDEGDAILARLGGGGRPARFAAWVRSIRPSRRPALNFTHVLLPHGPLQYLPEGHSYDSAGGRPRLRGQAAAKDPFLVGQAYQRHLLQVGFTDRLLGRLIARLRATGLWDRALVVVAADHGVSFRVGQLDRRTVTPENVEDIAPVPLFVKAPGQRDGRIRTRPVQTIDVLPTIADALGIRLPWRVDGRSAAAAPPDGRPAVDMLTRDWKPLQVDARALDRLRQAAVTRKERLFGSGGGLGLYAVGAHRELLGRPVTALGAAADEGADATIDAASELARVNPDGPLPALVSGRISGAGPGRHDLAIAVNGRVSTVSRSFAWEGRERFSAFAQPRDFRAGRNRVEVFLVPRSGPPRLLGRAGA